MLTNQNESSDGLIQELKEKIEEKMDRVSDIKDSVRDKISDIKDSASDKISDIKDSASDKISDIKDKGEEHLSTIKEHGSDQLENVKSEAEDLKRIFQSKDLIYRKSPALAIVLRKLGNTDAFLDVVEKLTKEGYRLVHQENVRDIPILAGFKYSFGSFYYFQHVKYIGKF